jgi:hypothetical protein
MAEKIPSSAALSMKNELNLYAKSWVDDRVVATLCKNLKSNKSITFLGFRNCTNVSNKSAIVLSKLLGSERFRPAALKKLILEFTSVGDLGVIALASSLNSTSLERLDFGQCSNVGNDGAIALAEAIADNTTLRFLVLQNCKKITDEGGIKMLEAIKKNSTMKSITIQGTGISASLRREIAAELKGR